MKPIFDFSKSYSGAIDYETESYPCNLTFENDKIVFALVRPENSLCTDRAMNSFSGYISTENGIMNFLATDAFQTMGSSNWRSYANAQYQANSLVITIENNDIHNSNFAQVNIEYDNIDQIGLLCWTEIDQDLQTPTFKLMRSFEELQIQEAPNSIILNNYVSYLQRYSSQNILSLNSQPFISYLPKECLTAQEFGSVIIRFSHFLQLLFSIRQQVSSVYLFQDPVPGEGNGASPFYFFNQDIIKAFRESYTRKNIHPPFNIEDIENIDLLFLSWDKFTSSQRRISRLYFGEINSKEYVRDDRFKNFCSIIQGLEAFGNLTNIPRVKGEMNAKLRKATSPELETLLFGDGKSLFMEKLFEIIGVQRDHYQHLNKPLRFDLNENPQDMITINAVLQAIIRYHLLKAIGLDQQKIDKIILIDVNYFKGKLKFLASRI